MPPAGQPLGDKRPVEGLPKATAELSGLLSSVPESDRETPFRKEELKAACAEVRSPQVCELCRLLLDVK